MEIVDHIAAVTAEGRLLALHAADAGLDASVPSCPGWDVRELLRHTGEIHLWAAAHVTNRATKMWVDDTSELTAYWPELGVFWPSDADLVGWYLDTNVNLVNALESAPLDLECRTFLPAPSPLAMWARRQAHETAIHRLDAQEAGDSTSGFGAIFAADGIDEILSAFAPRNDKFPLEESKLMLVSADDTGDAWYTTLGPDGITTERQGGDADVVVSGSASALYVSLWNRGVDAGVYVSGDSTVFKAWHENHRLRWS